MKHSRIRGLAPFVGAVIALAAASSYGAGEPKWTYGGATGPAKWAGLNPDYYVCGSGERQSPIDIQSARADMGALPSLLFDYKPSPLKVVDTGRTIQVNFASGNTLRIAGTKFELLHVQFHRPSEMKIDGKGQAMAAHLVHKSPDGKLAIVAVQLESGAGNALTKSVFRNLPKDKGKESTVEGVTVNALDLLPKDKKAYYTFNGSLTAPPCSEDVTWFVLPSPSSIAPDDIARFASAYPMNARPVQPLNGRPVQGTR
ncbi:MAG TPA: carbonic anhydrase family protein [Casimicrobiaceae bacterium]|nr:carbonic anhydrase family protein [Casimicrobiaceae bacterium]